MKKKIKDLTDEEMATICKKYHDCTREAGKVNCPLWLGAQCLKQFIQINRYLQKDVVLNNGR